MKFFILIFTIAFLPYLPSYADSGCWPEELLIGKTAIGFITNVKFNEFKTEAIPIGKTDNKKSAGQCTVRVYERPNEKSSSKTILCNTIQCIKDECDGESEYTALPVEEFKNPFAMIKLKDDKKVWFKLNRVVEVNPILTVGKVGTLFPETALLQESPEGKPFKIKSDKKLAYTVKKIAVVNKQEWAEVDVNPILTEEPLTLGKTIAHGHFLFRDKDNKVMGVLSEVWCD